MSYIIVMEFTDGVLFKNDDNKQVFLVPQSLREEIPKMYHNHEISLHMTRKSMYEILRKRFFLVWDVYRCGRFGEWLCKMSFRETFQS
jgi:hypothetical protein